MKRSNIIFFGLIAILYIMPFVIYGGLCLVPVENALTRFNGNLKVLKIDNPNLRSEDIIMDAGSSSLLNGPFEPLDLSNSLYYKGEKQYLPEVTESSIDDSVFTIKGAVDAEKETNLTLHVQMDSLHKIILNGEEVWSR